MVEMNKNTSYAQVPNRVLWDKNIPLSVKGMYAVVCSCGPAWHSTVHGFEKVMKEGRGAIGRYLKILEAAGYLRRTYKRTPDGKYADSEYMALAGPDDSQDEALDANMHDMQNNNDKEV